MCSAPASTAILKEDHTHYRAWPFRRCFSRDCYLLSVFVTLVFLITLLIVIFWTFHQVCFDLFPGVAQAVMEGIASDVHLVKLTVPSSVTLPGAAGHAASMRPWPPPGDPVCAHVCVCAYVCEICLVCGAAPLLLPTPPRNMNGNGHSDDVCNENKEHIIGN